tara:strand:- start:109 stop:495 length:387 start_codon:yes stop_codon:yes gene_type:complete
MLGLSSIMERISRVRVKDCFQDDETVFFVIPPGLIGKALGKGGSNIKRLQAQIKKRIKVIEYNDNILIFVRNIIYPLKAESIVEQDGEILVKNSNKKAKSLLIGRGGKNLKLLNRAVKRFFSQEVKII